MQIVQLRVENFRGIREACIEFGSHTVFIGPNNCGKTTIIEALALLLGRDRMVRTLTEHDFHGSDPLAADRIKLVATITGFRNDDPAEHPDWFRDDRGVPKWWNPATGIVAPVRDTEDCKLVCQIGFSAFFDRTSLEVETARYFHDDDAMGDVFDDETTVAVPGRLIREVGFFLVPASRTWDKVVSFGSELFRRVVAAQGAQPAASVLAERDRLRRPANPLEDDAHLRPVVDALNTELAGFFPRPPELSLRVTPTDSAGLLEAFVPHYGQAGASGLPARRHGSGLISLQHLLLLLQFGRDRAQAGEGFFMALEEPELHVPPPLQQRLVNRIQALSTQTLVSTHSPTIAAMSNPTSVMVLRNDNGSLSAQPLLSAPVTRDTANAVRKLFQTNRSETIAALMNESVLVPEGRYDFDWLSLISRAVDLHQGWIAAIECRFGSRVGLVPTHDAAVQITVDQLVRLHPKVAAVVDGDAEGRGYAVALGQAVAPPTVIVRWPDEWTIENVVGWVLGADPASVLAGLDPAWGVNDLEALVVMLKSKDRIANGLKGDYVAYEAIAELIGQIEPCRNRARSLLNDLASVVTGVDVPRFFTPAGQPRARVMVP